MTSNNQYSTAHISVNIARKREPVALRPRLWSGLPLSDVFGLCANGRIASIRGCAYGYTISTVECPLWVTSSRLLLYHLAGCFRPQAAVQKSLFWAARHSANADKSNVRGFGFCTLRKQLSSGTTTNRARPLPGIDRETVLRMQRQPHQAEPRDVQRLSR